VCAVSDRRVFKLSGLAATADGYVAINDGASNPADTRVFRLDGACRVQQVIAYPSTARDPEDLAIGDDGTVWIADIGDDNKNRATIAIWKLGAGATRPIIHRLTYPDGAHNAEALLLAAADTPLIITKEATPGIYRPTRPLVANSTAGVPLVKVGELKLPDTNTANSLSFVGRKLVTGAANAPDNKRVVVRTYSDAYEWDVSDGDIVKAITTSAPLITPLPEEPQGEAITYSANGASFITVSDLDNSKTTKLLRYRPTPPPRPQPTTGAATANPAERGILDGLTIDGITTIVAGIGGFGLLLVLIGMAGIRRSRHRRAAPGVTAIGRARPPDPDP
jgi:hypothetical protein